jgi:hypothetical protein
MHKQIGEIPSPSEVRFGEEFFDEPEFNETEKTAPHVEQERREEDVASERKQERTTEEFSGRLRPDEPVLVGEDNVFPIEAFPPVIRNLAESFAKTWDTSPETVAMSMLTVAGASIGKWAYSNSDKGKPVRGNIFTYISLRASGKKSVAFDEAMSPVVQYNEKRREDHEEFALDELQAEIDDLESEIKKAKDQGKNGGRIDTNLLTGLYRKKRKAEAKKSFWPIQSSDFTIQALIKKGIRTKSVFIASDEAKVVQNIILGQYDNGNSNEPFLCKLYSSSSHERERVGGDSSSVSGICGTVLLLGQPHITRSLFEDDTMKQSGLVQRFLFAAVPSELKEEDANPPAIKNRSSYHSAIENLLQRYWEKWENLGEMNSETEEPVTEEELMVQLRFSQAAFTAFREFRNSIVRSEYARKIETLDAIIDRLKENAMRVAIILHVVKNIPTETKAEISVETAQEAIAIVKWSFGQYLEFSHSTREDELSRIQKNVIKFVKEKGKVTARMVSRKFKAEFASTSKAEEMLKELVRKFILEAVKEEKTSTAGRSKSNWYKAI